MRMIADWAHVAYEAGRRLDMESIYAVLTEIAPGGRATMDAVIRSWMNRTLMVMHEAGGVPTGAGLVQLEMETDGTGEVGEIDQLCPEVAWAGRMFVAHVRHDRDMWEALWSGVPADPEIITDHVAVLLTTMTTTAAAYAENAKSDRPDPQVIAARFAVAHMN